jgi:protein kinase C substrate 80K-H
MEHKKQSRTLFILLSYIFGLTRNTALYQELLTHSRALKSLQGHYKRLQEKERTLANILSTLKDGYNPNYQDMAVLEAVRGWDAYHGEESSDDQVVPITDSESTETVDTQESDFSAEEIVDHANDLLAKDHENLLIQHDEHIAQLEEEDGSDCECI